MSVDVTVLMSTYNGEGYVDEQIKSIMQQIGVNINLFIRDDGSTDTTTEKIEKMMTLYPHIQLEKGDNVGIWKSFDWLYRNCGEFDYYAFSDQDDVWDQDKIITAINKLRSNDANYYSSTSRLVSNELKEIKSNEANYLYKKYNYYMNGISKILTSGSQGCTIVMDQLVMDKLRSYVPNKTIGHDTYIDIIANYTCKCVFDKEPHMSYRQHNESWTGNREKKVSQRIKSIKFYFAGMKRYSFIADDILKGYGREISEADREVLNLLVQTRTHIRARLILLTKFSFGKYGFFQNTMFKVALLMGKV